MAAHLFGKKSIYESCFGAKPRPLGFGSPARYGGGKPAVGLHPRKQGIECARACVIAMVAQLLEHPVANDRPLGGVVQNVHLPKRKENFAIDGFHIGLHYGNGKR